MKDLPKVTHRAPDLTGHPNPIAMTHHHAQTKSTCMHHASKAALIHFFLNKTTTQLRYCFIRTGWDTSSACALRHVTLVISAQATPLARVSLCVQKRSLHLSLIPSLINEYVPLGVIMHMCSTCTYAYMHTYTYNTITCIYTLHAYIHIHIRAYARMYS